MRSKLTIILLVLVALMAAPIWAQSYPATDTFGGTGALSSSWTNTTANGTTYVALAQASGKVVPSVSASKGMASYTGVTFTNDQYVQAKWVTHTTTNGANALCVRTSTTGNGICWLADGQAVYLMSGGVVAGSSLITGCPIPASGDTLQFLVVGTTFTCTDVTTGAHASGSNSIYFTGAPTIIVDQNPSTSYALASFQADCSPTCSLGTVATPTFSPAAGTYSSAQTVTISDSTSGATIHYTTDGTTPTASSTTYSSPINVSATEAVKAIGVKSGYSNSAVGSAAYTIASAYPATDTFGGTGALSSSWTNTTANGTTYVALAQASGKVVPSVSASKGMASYTGVTFTNDQYVQAKWVTHTTTNGANALCVRTSTTGNGICWLADGQAVYLMSGGVVAGSSLITGCPIPASGDTLQFLVVGTTFTCTDVTTGAHASGSNSIYFTGAPTIIVDQNPSTSYALASFQADCSPTCGSGSTPAATPTFSPAAGTYTSAQTVTISDSTSGATIYYTTNGSTPTTGSTVYSAPINVSTTETVKAIATAPGYTASAVGSAAYTINLTVATPTFSPGAGTYTSPQTVTISDSTSGATIYYTTNGTTPTTGSTVYSTPISVSTSETVKALAVKSGYTNSAVGSAAYVINLTVAIPTFSPGAGTYTSPQTVTISDSTSGATIYYTTNGTTPTTGSTVYSSPISVSISETVKALGVKSGYTNSAIGSAVYTISSGTKTVSSIAISPQGGVLQPGSTLQLSVVCTYTDHSTDNCTNAGGATWSVSRPSVSSINSSGLFTESAPPAWQASHAYALGALVTDSNGYIEQAAVAGTSGSSITWPGPGGSDSAGGSFAEGDYFNDLNISGFCPCGVTDGTVSWELVGTTADESYALVSAGGYSDRAGIFRQHAGETWYQYPTPDLNNYKESTNNSVLNPMNVTVGSTVTMGSAIVINDANEGEHTGTPFQTTCNWTSSNTGIATVDRHGQVTGVSPGAVDITCGRAGNGVFGSSTASGWVSPGNVTALTVSAAGTGNTTWYVRPDGGTVYSSTNTSGQCTGKTNAAYPGSGTNQACAAGNIRDLWADGVTYYTVTWLISGGDTVIVAQNSAGYNVGVDASGGPGLVNCAGTNYGCYMPSIPSGSATQHTRILGANYASCHADSAKTLLNVSYGANAGFNVTDSQFVDIACFEVSDQAACGIGNYTNNCNGMNSGNDGILESALTGSVTYTDLFIHGLANEGIHGATGMGVVANYVHIKGVPGAGIDMDDDPWDSGNISVAGGFTMTNSTTEWVGCVEEYPVVHNYPYIECRDQSTGGYADGFGTASTTGNWYFANDIWQYNWQDGLDLLHSGMQNLTVIDSFSQANVGQAFKIGSGDNVVFQNNIAMANCLRVGTLIGDEPASALAPGGGAPGDGYGLCRANGNVIFNFTNVGTYAVQNNTIVETSSADVPVGINCEGGWDFCQNANAMFQNNLMMGYLDLNPYTYNDGDLPAMFYLGSPDLVHQSFSESTNMPQYNGWSPRNHNLFYNVRSGWCPTPLQLGETCNTENPLFVDQPASPISAESDLDGFNFKPSSSSPAIGAGIAIPAITNGAGVIIAPALTTDYTGATRPNPPSIGAIE